jgi:hypothetical protein
MPVVMSAGGGFIDSHLLPGMVGAGMDATLIGPHIASSRVSR